MLNNVRRFYRDATRASSDVLLIYTNLGHCRNSVPNVELLWRYVQKDFPNILPKNVFLVWKKTFPNEIGLVVSVDCKTFEGTLKSKCEHLPSNVEFTIRRVMSCNYGRISKLYKVDDGETPFIDFSYVKPMNPSNTLDVFFTILDQLKKDNPTLEDDDIHVESATNHMGEIVLSFSKTKDGCDMERVKKNYESQSPGLKLSSY